MFAQRVARGSLNTVEGADLQTRELASNYAGPSSDLRSPVPIIYVKAIKTTKKMTKLNLMMS